VLGILYDQQASLTVASGAAAAAGPVCDGAHCFMPAFQVLLGCDCLALLLVLALYRLIAAGDGLLPLPIPRMLLKAVDKEDCNKTQQGGQQGGYDSGYDVRPASASSAMEGREGREGREGMYCSADGSMRKAWPSSLELKRNNSSFIIPS
jgi:hypothetical protein